MSALGVRSRALRAVLGLALGVSTVVVARGPAPASPVPATAAVPVAVPSEAAAPGVAAAPSAASRVRQPSTEQVRLAGMDAGVLAAAPAPHGHGDVHAHAAQPLRPALAARIKVRRPAELVAISADAPFPAGTSIQVRVKERRKGWSRWTELPADAGHGPDPGSAEARGVQVGSEPLLARNATKVLVRIDTPTGEVPAGTAVTLVNAPVARSDPRGRPVATMGTADMPPIITRAQWGADESWRSRAPLYTDNLKVGFVHHTASTSSYSREQAASQLRAIYAYHTQSLGHSDIDYNFLVDRFGRLYEGRAGGIDRPVLGGHTAGFNEHTFAISALGDFENTATPAPEMAAMKDSIARLLAWKLGLHGVRPSATAELVSAGYPTGIRYPAGSVATLPAIATHTDVVMTSCPGRHILAQMPGIRALAQAYATASISPPSPASASVAEGTSVALTAAATGGLTWTADIFSPCADAPVRTLTGSIPGRGEIPISWDLRDGAGQPVRPTGYRVRVSGTTPEGVAVDPVWAGVTVTPAAGGAWGPCAQAIRVVGADLPGTSVQWGRRAAAGSRVVVLTGTPDAGPAAAAAGLVAAPLARVLGGPLLLTAPASLSGAVAEDIRARGATRVVIVGGPGVVSDAAAAQVAALGVAVTRLAGATDAATAAAVAAQMPKPASAVLTSMAVPAHALAGSALAAARGVPLLLADQSGAIPAETAAALARRKRPTVVASPVIADPQVTAVAGRRWTRIDGPDASGVTAAVAAVFPDRPAEVALVSPDPGSWSAGPLAAAAGLPVVVVGGPGQAPAVAGLLGSRRTVVQLSTPTGLLGDDVLGAWQRVMADGPRAAAKQPRPTKKRRIGKADAAPEPTARGAVLTVSATLLVRHSDRSWRPAPPGLDFVVQFRKRGARKYRTVAAGTTQLGLALAQVPATASGSWRVVVGSARSKADAVRVR